MSEEAQCAIFLGLLTGSEASEQTSHGGGSEKLTWATIDKGVEEGSLDQVEEHQVRLQRRKRKERDANASGTPGVKKIVTDVLAALGYDDEVEEKEEPIVRVEEIVGDSEEVIQQLKAGTIREEPIVVESDDEGQEGEGESDMALLGGWKICWKRKEVVEVPEEEEEDDDEEDERLRQEEGQRAELRAKKRGAREEAEPSLPDSVPKRKKYTVRMEEGFDVERMVDKLLEGHNDLMNLTDILASAPRLRADEEAYYERERGLIRRMREHALTGSCRINDENEGKLIIGEPDFLSPQERALMVGLMKKRHRAYAFNDDERGRLDVDKIPTIRIHTVPHESWNLRGARYPNPDEEKMVVDYLDGKMRTHVADYSSGPYASPWFCFIKPNGTLRWVQDLQRLNAVTVRGAGGLPNADALSESCAGRPIISLIDLYSRYDQFPVYPPDRPVTAMHTSRGLIHMNVAPQGWTNAVAMVQRHVIRAMQTVSPHITQPYIDDLAVKGPKEKEEDEVMSGVRRFVWKHVQDIDQVLGLLEEHNLTVSGPKSKHCMREATISGFVCNEGGRRSDVKKTDKILEWPVPFRSITDVRSFLGTCGFWRSVVKDFATKTEHLRKLVRQDQEWVWGEDQEEAVGRMKGEFKEGGLVLGTPNYEATEERPFVIETDAGPTALGGVLIQADTEGKERLLRFESRTPNTTERNYSQFKKEALAVLHCLRTFRNYVFGRRLILRMDPIALACSLKNYTPFDPTVARWLTYIWMFNFELERIPGNKNRADGLSRINWDGSDEESIEDTPPVDGFLDQEEDVRLHINEWSLRVPSTHSLVEEVRTIEEGPTQVEEREQLMGGIYLLTNTLFQGDFDRKGSFSHEENEILVPESRDDEFEEGEIKEAFRAEEYDGIYRELGLLLSCEMRDRDASAKAQKMRHLYVVRDDHLFIKRQVGNPKGIVCGRNRQTDIIAALHDGIARGHRGVGATCAKISELYHCDGMLKMVIKYCRSCIPCQERSAQRLGEPLHPRLEREVGAVVHLHLLFMLAGENGCNYIFDARDNLTGFVDRRAIRTKTDPILANCIKEYYLRYPFVREFVMDRGSEFTCNEVRTLLARHGVVANYTTATHPQANAPVEKGHSTIMNLLAKWTEGKPGQWSKFLRAAFFVENVTVKKTTKYAPATLWYGRRATFPIESFMKTWRRQDLEVNLSFEELLDIRARQVGAAEERLREAVGQVERSRMEDKMRSDFSKTAMQKGGRGARPRQRPQGASGGDDSRKPVGRESTPIFDDGNIELFLDSYQAHVTREGWSTLERIRNLRGVGRFEEPIAHIREEALTWQDVEARMQMLRASPMGPDGLPIRLEEGNAEEFIPAYEHDLRGPSPTLPEGGEAVSLRTPLDRLEAPRCVPVGGVTAGSGPERTGMARQYWPEGIPKLDSKEVLGPPPEATTPPPTQAEPERGERARTPTTVAPQLTESTGACMGVESSTFGEPPPEPPPAEEGTSERDPLREGHEARTGRPPGEMKEEKRARVQVRLEELYQEKLRMEAAGEAPKSPIDPPTSEQRISEAWASYESERDAARLGSREVFLNPAEAAARREAEERRFSFRTPTELASQQATPMTIEIPEDEPAQGPQPPVEEGGSTKESPTILLEVQEGALTGAAASTESEAMGGEASRLDELVAVMELDMPSGEPQRQKTPERVPEIGELRTQLGSWTTGADSGEQISKQQHEVMREPATAVTPQPSDLYRDEGATAMGGIREGRPLRLDTPAYRPEGGEALAGPSTQMMEAGPAESWSMPQSHEMSRETSETPPLPGSQKKKRRCRGRSNDQCFFCKDGVHRALEGPKFLKDKAAGRVTESGGRMYDRQGRVVERAPDGVGHSYIDRTRRL
ncbi:hypothetical protein CBR_g49997 [Chara braunii]|uniref:Integrase catalytic domain-containing protein n=1 Tax=Chara braunii TaxID=69332 RepID=A0A388K589_CHABU|nr:hypothetical protein CBR_g49997 [Chara braunii]|eukprot:GBG65205.1 hypothetical protein CBR_g49997 [Chara braunii]